MIECGFCGGRLHENAKLCPGCGAKKKRDLRGLVTGPAFFIVAINVAQYSYVWPFIIALGGVYGLSTLRHSRWKAPKKRSA